MSIALPGLGALDMNAQTGHGGRRRVKVMYVDHTARLSGGEIALTRLLPALIGKVDPLVVLGEDGPLVERMRSIGARVAVLPLPTSTGGVRKEALAAPWAILSRMIAVLRYSWRLRRLIRHEGVDIVHTNSLKAGFYGCLAARLARVPSIWHLRDRVARDYLPYLAVLVTWAALALLPNRVLCNSVTTMMTIPPLVRRATRGRAVVVHRPIHDVLDSPVQAVRGKPRRDREGARVESEAFTIGLVGRFAPWKGQLEAVRSLADPQMPAEARLRVIGAPMFGEEAYEELVRSEVARLGLGARVDFVGFVDDVLGELKGLDLVLHASTIPEPFGQVIVEGMAAGVPILATRGGGPSEIITEGVDGLLYPAGDTAELARLVRRLWEDEKLRSRLREGGLRRARDFSSAVIAPMVLELYDGLISGFRRSAA